MDLMETGCEDGRWMELAQDRVQRQAVIVLNPALLKGNKLALHLDQTFSKLPDSGQSLS